MFTSDNTAGYTPTQLERGNELLEQLSHLDADALEAMQERILHLLEWHGLEVEAEGHTAETVLELDIDGRLQVAVSIDGEGGGRWERGHIVDATANIPESAYVALELAIIDASADRIAEHA